MFESQVYEIGKNGGLVPLVSTFDNLQPGTVVEWGGNQAWGPTKYCILERHESNYGVDYKGFDIDTPDKNAKLHHIEARSIKSKDDPAVWHSQHYFIHPEVIPAEVVEQYRQQHATQSAEFDKRANELKTEDDRLEALGRELWPSLIGDCPAVIVAEKHYSDCDGMTDYYASHITERVILCSSSHKRDLFPELRKAAALIPETLHFTTPPDEDSNGEKRTEENKKWWNPKDEHREKYSMGAGYYLSDGGVYSGWHVEKDTFWKGAPSREDYICLAKRHDHLKTTPKEPEQNAGAVTFAVEYERDWTWIKFDNKPAAHVLESLKAQGAKFSGKRAAWYFTRHLESAELQF
jgi:hypothetical protein